MIDRSPAGCPLETRLPGTSNRIAPAEFRVAPLSRYVQARLTRYEPAGRLDGRLTGAAMSASLVRSQWMKRASPQLLGRRFVSATLMPAMTTLQPYPASVTATDCPINVEPPATMGGFAVKPSHAQPRLFGIVGKPAGNAYTFCAGGRRRRSFCEVQCLLNQLRPPLLAIQSLSILRCRVEARTGHSLGGCSIVCSRSRGFESMAFPARRPAR